MSEFFESEIIQEELEEINRLQQTIYGHLMDFGAMTRGDKIEHVEQLTTLLEKQRIMYTRLSLSDDPQALEMRENLKRSVSMMGFPDGTDVQFLFDAMYKTIEALKQHIDV